mgnify:CR=1 FL=1
MERIVVAFSHEEAQRRIPVGTPAVYRAGCTALGNKLLCGKALDDRSCFAVLLDAAEQLLSQGRRVKVLVAGEGSAEAALRLRAVSFPQGTVFFAGFIERVERALWAMDAQINASTESEGTSLSLLEGMSFGLPAVVSDIGGNPLLIQDGENGLVFPNRDSQALAGCVARLMDDPALLRRLGEGAKRSFEENYTGEIFAKHVEDVYRDVLKGVSHGTK